MTAIKRTSPVTIELSIKAPLIAHRFKPGQFCRLQNFESFAPHLDHTMLQMEPLALVRDNYTEVARNTELFTVVGLMNGLNRTFINNGDSYFLDLVVLNIGF